MDEYQSAKAKDGEKSKSGDLSQEIAQMASKMSTGRDIQNFLRKIQVVGRNNSDPAFASHVSRKSLASLENLKWDALDQSTNPPRRNSLGSGGFFVVTSSIIFGFDTHVDVLACGAP